MNQYMVLQRQQMARQMPNPQYKQHAEEIEKDEKEKTIYKIPETKIEVEYEKDETEEYPHEYKKEYTHEEDYHGKKSEKLETSESDDIYRCFDKISTNLTCGALMHQKAAEYFYRTNLYRGLARWNECEAKGDAKDKACLNKLIVDYFHYVPMEDKEKIEHSIEFSYKDLKGFLEGWHAWEEDFLAEIRYAICLLAKEGKCEYVFDKLKCLAKGIVNEMFCIQKLMDRFEATEYMAHDVLHAVMLQLHQYFEKDYDGGTIDFDI